jgi:formylglycine-generating enzyme required for sulfatase activity
MGFHDMLGNVWAWCSDGYEPYALEAMADPSGAAEGSYRVVRGGSWSDHARDVRAAIRFPYAPGIRNAFIGFRLARGQ